MNETVLILYHILALIFAAVGIVLLLPRFLISAGAGTAAGTAVLIVCGALAVAVSAILPVRMLRKRNAKENNRLCFT